MKKSSSEILRHLDSRVARLEKQASLQIARSIVDEIDDYIDDVWGMDSEWCYNKVIDQKQGVDKLYAIIEIGCEDAGIDPEYMIVSQKNNRQVLEKMEILSLREAQIELKRMR